MPILNCQWCNTDNSVITRKSTRKRGLSGAKVIIAIITGGLSLLFGVGLSRKVPVTILNCSACGFSEAVDA